MSRFLELILGSLDPWDCFLDPNFGHMTTLSVHIENTLLPKLPGDTVKGHLEMYVRSAISAREVEISLVGTEKSYMEVGDGSSHQEVCFLKVPIPLCNQPVVKGKIKPGTYLLTFEVELPDTELPSWTKFGTHFHEIKYYISARVFGSGRICDYHGSASIEVIGKAPPIPVDASPPYLEQRLERLTWFWGQNQGQITISVDQIRLKKSNDASISVSVLNKSNLDIVGAWLTIWEKNHWQLDNSSIIESRSVRFAVMRMLPTGLAFQKRQNQATAKTEVQADLQKGGYCFRLLVPETARSSYYRWDGKPLERVECKHVLSVCLVTRKWLPFSNLGLDLLVTIRAKNGMRAVRE